MLGDVEKINVIVRSRGACAGRELIAWHCLVDRVVSTPKKHITCCEL